MGLTIIYPEGTAMTATTTPTGYRTVTVDEAPFGTIDASIVVINGWAHSTWTTDGDIVAKVRRIDTGETHPTLNGVTYATGDDARRAAYEAGVLAYHVRQVNH